MTIHTCHAFGCNKPVPPKYLMCRRHWSMVSLEGQRLIWRTYRPGQEVDKTPSVYYLAAQTAAVFAVAKRECWPREDLERLKARADAAMARMRATAAAAVATAVAAAAADDEEIEL